MLHWPNKDPDEVLDYQLDWADPADPRLQPSELLTSSTWTLISGDVVIASNPAPSFTAGGLTTVWLTGGTSGTPSVLCNRVTTSVGRTYEINVKLRVREA